MPTLARTTKDLKPVLKDKIEEVKTVYKVTQADNSWSNKTVIEPGKLGEEYNKTFGHYHNVKVDETYKVGSGEGILVLQKKHLEGGKLTPEKVDEVFIIRAVEGDTITIKPEYGHSWSNVGKKQLVLYDDWEEGHTERDYEPIKKVHGMGYYIVEGSKGAEPTPNPNYKNLPQALWVSLKSFNEVK